MLKKNIIANYLGQGWTVLMGLAFVPFYIQYLGIESYGLIALFSIMQAWMGMLDAGMTPALNREMARFKAGEHSNNSIRDLLRSIELIYISVAVVIVLTAWLAAPFIAKGWLKFDKLPIETVILTIGIMGFVVATRLWEEVYRGVIQGLQYQVWLNKTQALLATIRWAGALCVLVWISPTIQLFFLWQALISFVSIFIYAKKTYGWLPHSSRKSKFSLDVLKKVKGFAGGVALISALAMLLTQVDKFLLSGLLSLEQFGYYALASVVASGVSQLVTPINSAIYPRFSELVATNNISQLVEAYHDTSQLMAAIIIAPAFVISVFSNAVLLLWTGNQSIASSAGPILQWLIIGTLINGFVNVPYMLQLAYGWTRFPIAVNIIAVGVIVPAVILVVPKYGPIGAAFIGMNFMYGYILPKERRPWFQNAVIIPFFIGGAVANLLTLVFSTPKTRLDSALTILFALFCVEVAVILVLPNVRSRLYRSLRHLYERMICLIKL